MKALQETNAARLRANDDGRCRRRAFKADEFREVVLAAKTGPDWQGVTGAERSLLYALADETRLSSTALRSLIPPSFQLDGERPSVTIGSKILRLSPELAADLADYLDGRPTDQPCLRLPRRVCEMSSFDLHRAKVRWMSAGGSDLERRKRLDNPDFLEAQDAAGRVLDFHSLTRKQRGARKRSSTAAVSPQGAGGHV